MSGSLEWFVFTLPDDSRHLVDDRVPAVLAMLGEEVGGRFAVSYFKQKDRIAVSNDEASLRAVWELARAGEDEYASLSMWYTDEKYHHIQVAFSLTLPLQAMVMVSGGDYNDDQPSLMRVGRVLRTCGVLCRELHPIYGYGPGSPGYPPGWRLGMSTPEALYDCNFFGPALVEKYGRDRLLNLPAWRVEQFADGALLIRMSDNPWGRYPLSHAQDYENVAQQLGLTTLR